MRVSMSKTLVLFALIISALPVVAMALLLWGNNFEIREIADRQFDKIAVKATKQMVDDILRICKMIYKTQSDSDSAAGSSLRNRLAALGTPSVSESSVEASVWRQGRKSEKFKVKIPQFSFGKSQLQLNIAPDGSILSSGGKIQDVLDMLKSDTGLEYSLFLKVGEAGDMLRVATSIRDADDNQYLGACIPSGGGSDDGEILRTLMARKIYSGVLHADDFTFLSNYEPLLNSEGEIIGAISYGRNFASIDYLLKYFEGMRLGVNGYVWAVELVGRGESVYKVSRDGKRNGVVVENDSYAERRDSTIEIIDNAVSQGDGKICVRQFKASQFSRSEDDIIVVYSYFKPWNMIFGAAVNRNDFNTGVEVVESSAERFIIMLLPLGILMLAFAAGTAFWASRRGMQMTSILVESARLMERGDIKNARRQFDKLIDSRQWSNLEIYELCVSLKKMSENLASLVAKVKSGGVNLAGAAKQISAAAAKIEDVAIERANRLSELSGAIDSISKSAIMLKSDAEDASGGVSESLSVASDGKDMLERLDENIFDLLDATQSVSARIAIIKDKTDRIANVVSTIDAVSSRTNMLALNAAMEAERAGDSGAGFGIVSREIGRLADITAVSSMRVSKMASDMKNSVESGVSETELFENRVRMGADTIGRVSDGLKSTRVRVAELQPKFEMLARGISAHAAGASKIRLAAAELAAAAGSTREIVEDIKSMTYTLESTADSLTEKVSRFRL